MISGGLRLQFEKAFSLPIEQFTAAQSVPKIILPDNRTMVEAIADEGGRSRRRPAGDEMRLSGT
jgi:hypothetical protein